MMVTFEEICIGLQAKMLPYLTIMIFHSQACSVTSSLMGVKTVLVSLVPTVQTCYQRTNSPPGRASPALDVLQGTPGMGWSAQVGG